MQTITKDSGEVALPFVSRKKESARLQRLPVQRKHALIIGPAGIGKTALVDSLQSELELLICPQSEHLGSICKSLETQLNLRADGLLLRKRKQALLEALASVPRTVVFDGVGWMTPKLSSFLESVMERMPTWICARSDHSWDIGHCWTLLVRFERIELPPFRLADTRACVAAAVESGLLPSGALNLIAWLHHQSKGVPLVLRQLCEELANQEAAPDNPFALRRLELDRRIHEVFPPQL